MNILFFDKKPTTYFFTIFQLTFYNNTLYSQIKIHAKYTNHCKHCKTYAYFNYYHK